MGKKFHIIIEKGVDGFLLSEVVGLPGCHSQAKTIDELLVRTKEAIKLYLEVQKPEEPFPEFLSVKEIELQV